MTTKKPVMTFDITIDGSLQDVKGDIEGVIPDQQTIHKLLYNAQKVLIDEEVVCVTLSSKLYTMRITANGAKFTGVVTRNDSTSE